MKTSEIIYSKVGTQTYSESTGAHQAEWDKLYESLVPSTGRADTLCGEVVRAVSRLYNEYLTNGNGNAVEPQYERNGYGDIIDDGEITGVELDTFYGQFIDLLDWYFGFAGCGEGRRLMIDIKDLVLTTGETNYLPGNHNDAIFDDAKINTYDRLIDLVTTLVWPNRHAETKIPEWYTNN